MVYNVQCKKLCPLSKCSLRLLGLFGWTSCLQRTIYLELDNIRCQGYIAAILVQVEIRNFLINYHYITAILPNDTYIVELNGCHHVVSNPWNFYIWTIKDSASIHKTINSLIFEAGLCLGSPCSKENSNSSHANSVAASSVRDFLK